jgi:molybdopterin synthase sulfur carrier subunit
MATVTLDPLLAEFVPKRHLTSDAASVDDLLTDLERRYPALKFRLRDEAGTIRRFVKVFVNGQELRALRGRATPLAKSDSVDVLHSIQGG